MKKTFLMSLFLVFVSAQTQTFLSPVNTDEPLILDACDGSETIGDPKDVFKAGIDPSFKSWNANDSGPATKEEEVKALNLVKSGTFVQMFGYLNPDISKSRLTHGQVINYCKKYEKYLVKNGWTFFLYKSGKNFFVARVGLRSDGLLDASVYRLENNKVWETELGYRLVVPKLPPGN